MARETQGRWVGAWWLPAEPERQVHGELQWNSAARLEIHPGLAPMPREIRADDAPRYPVIHGRTTSSTAVTIFDAFSANRQLNFLPHFKVQSEVISAPLVVIGAHLSPHALFEAVEIEVPGLVYWLPTAYMQLDSPEGDFSKGFSLGIDNPADEVATRSDALEITWVIRREMSGTSSPHATVTTHAGVRIRAHAPRTLDDYLAAWGRLAALLTFAWGTGVTAGQIRGLHEGKEIQVHVRLTEAAPCGLDDWHRFLLPKHAPGFDFNDAVNRWFAVADCVDMPTRLARSVLSTTDGWIHLQFLSLMQALEGFHRALEPGLYMDDTEFQSHWQAMADAIPDAIRGDHRVSLKNRLRYGNQISLRKRLKDLCERLPAPLVKMVLGGYATPPSSWVETRNYYTHWDEASRPAILDEHGLVEACHRLRVLLTVLYLEYAGVPPELLTQALLGTSDLAQQLIAFNSSKIRQRDPTSNAGLIASITPLTSDDVHQASDDAT